MTAAARVVQRNLLTFVDLVKTFGPARAVGVTVSWLLRREFLVFVRELHTPLPELKSRPEMAWANLTEADIAKLRQINPLLEEADIRRRLRDGQTCLLGWIDGTLAHYRWESVKATYLPYLGRVFRPLAGDLLADEVFTRPEFRGRGFNAVGGIASLHRAREMGYSRSISIIAWWNTPALRSPRYSTGRSVVGKVGYRSVGWGRRYFTSGAVRFDEQGRFYLLPTPG